MTETIAENTDTPRPCPSAKKKNFTRAYFPIDSADMESKLLPEWAS